MHQRVIGRCSICNGAVTIPEAWAGTHPPAATCNSCHATSAHEYLPVINMRKPGDTDPRARKVLLALADSLGTADHFGDVSEALMVGLGLQHSDIHASGAETFQLEIAKRLRAVAGPE